MASRKRKFHQIDESEHLIHITLSDGVADHRPPANQLNPVEDDQGKVNYFKKLSLNDPPARKWRIFLGKMLAKDEHLNPLFEWQLGEWPQNYELYVHRNGVKHKPRTDMYLYGYGEGPSRRFRSPQEFLPHARWLMRGAKQDDECHCKMCSGIHSQRIINIIEHIPGPSVPKKLERVNDGDGARVSQRPRLHPNRASDQEVPAVAINDQLKDEVRSRRMYRLGEIVWVHIQPPLVSDASSEILIAWWPAIVQKITGPDRGEGPETATYQVLMLATEASYVLAEDQMVPYRVNPPSAPLGSMAPGSMSMSDVHRGQHFHPLPGALSRSRPSDAPPSPPARTFENAVVPYLVATRTAEKLSTTWCLTDPYDFISEKLKQDRFQGLWWGPERIWLGDLVRIRSSRTSLRGDLLPPSPGAENRGVLLRISAFYLRVEETDEDTKWHPMVSGTLYELAQEDDEDYSSEESESAASSNGSSYLPLPPPPQGYRFRRVLPSPDDDAHIELHHIAGRYYSNLLYSCSLLPRARPPKETGSSNPARSYPGDIISLSGLASGQQNAAEVRDWKDGRLVMLQSGHNAALSALNIDPASTDQSPSSSTEDLFGEGSSDGGDINMD